MSNWEKYPLFKFISSSSTTKFLCQTVIWRLSVFRLRNSGKPYMSRFSTRQGEFASTEKNRNLHWTLTDCFFQGNIETVIKGVEAENTKPNTHLDTKGHHNLLFDYWSVGPSKIPLSSLLEKRALSVAFLMRGEGETVPSSSFVVVLVSPPWMNAINSLLRTVVRNWPFVDRFGAYAFLPAFFISGAALEFFMIKWHVGEVNFYTVYKRNRVEELASKQAQQEYLSLRSSSSSKSTWYVIWLDLQSLVFSSPFSDPK